MTLPPAAHLTGATGQHGPRRPLGTGPEKQPTTPVTAARPARTVAEAAAATAPNLFVEPARARPTTAGRRPLAYPGQPSSDAPQGAGRQ
ncbi:hypothetical protein [Kitasatospora sp. NBC_01302]|uniref:hypothetical protein n=1 Tax=Kitasatospora sp. NBC_01302 TaxID=2903575 RepID=UPI002E0F2E83|nr:hypothetical protein OG294_40815 [Kitasatospora sp. NBC_01302]